MPNWCENRVTIMTETAEEMAALRQAVTEGDNVFSLNAILPRPEILNRVIAPMRRDEDGRILLEGGIAATDEEAAEIEAAGGNDWYAWSVDNWGTKWNTSADQVSIDDIEDNQVVYHFDTAWCPPERAIEELRRRFPDADINAFYDEPGMQMAGYY